MKYTYTAVFTKKGNKVYAKVPDLIGMPARECARALRSLGFGMQADGEGIAISQSPAAGTYAAAGDTVTVKLQVP